VRSLSGANLKLKYDEGYGEKLFRERWSEYRFSEKKE
jgi:hypothetical protein